VTVVAGVLVVVAGHASHGKPRRSEGGMARVALTVGGLRW
jgi:hypothetical protein